MKILKTVNLKDLGKKHTGKVRDFYIIKDKRVLVTTDRISAFDRVLGCIPEKGQVLNLLSDFWFKNTTDIVDNQMIAVPHPNVTIAKNAKPIPIEMVVRGYISGVTNTSIWGSYANGERIIYGIKFPDGLLKNQKLKTPVITPTTKADSGHDERLTRDEILKRKIISPKMYTQMEDVALKLFERGTIVCKKGGLILVDTKYEFGILNGKLILIDEIHTPDSSRFWIEKTYKERILKNLEPENFDKEFLRIWYKKKGYTGDGRIPKMTPLFIKQVEKRYTDVFKKITGKSFKYSHKKITSDIFKEYI